MTFRFLRCRHAVVFQAIILKRCRFTKYRLNENGEPVLAGNEGTTSGGYTSYIFRYAAKELFDISLTADDVDNQTNGVSIQPGKNSDYSELILQRDNIELLRFAIANGFRNIQNIVRKIKPGDGKLAKPAARSARKSATAMSHFVEVMACPSGCINGGGQLKTEGALDKEGVALASKELTQRADRLYKSVGNGTGGVIEAPEENLAMMKLYSELGSDCFDGLRTDESKFISGNW
ncbi:iron hydrogenase [Chytridium lagenaria]|nr:iron hydrogenase [Chytridium lagenaria]